MAKHYNIGIPFNDNTFDKTKIMTLSKITLSSNDTFNNYNNLQSLLNNTIKYQMLYPLNIYWMNENNYIIPYNIIYCVKNTINQGKKIIICRINIIGEILHANILLIDILKKRIIRFEPHGGIDKDNFYILDNKIHEIFLSDPLFHNFKYFKPIDYEPINGLQSVSQETNNLNIRKGDMGGFCLAWCLWWVEFYTDNNLNDLLSDNKLKIIIHKVIKKIINNGYLLSEYIRNYANYMHQKLIANISSKTLSISNLYYEKYTESDLDIIYSKINDDFLKII